MAISRRELIRIQDEVLRYPDRKFARVLNISPTTITNWRRARVCVRGTAEAAVRLLVQVKFLEEEKKRLSGELDRLRTTSGISRPIRCLRSLNLD